MGGVKRLNNRGMSTLSISLIIGALVTAGGIVFPHAISSLAAHGKSQFDRAGGTFLNNHQQASQSATFMTSRSKPVDKEGDEIKTNKYVLGGNVYKIVSAQAGYTDKQDFSEATGPATKKISDEEVAKLKIDPSLGMRK